MIFDEQSLGNPHSKIWVVSATPKKGESRPMSSQNNNWFMTYLYNQGLNNENVHFEYLVNDLPKKGGLEVFYANGTVQDNVRKLKNKIIQYRPNLVLCLGNDVLKGLFNRNEVASWRGHILLLDGGVKALITFDPVAAHRQRFVDNSQKPGQYSVLMRQDIRKAYQQSLFPETNFEPTPLHICTQYGDTVQRLEEMYNEGNFVSFDIEVIEPYDGRLMDCLSLSDEEHASLCIPLWRPTGDPKNKKDRGIARCWKNEHEFVHIFKLVKQILESIIPKVAQNSQYDITTLEYYYGIKINNLVWDTMVAAHSIFCDLPKDLGTLISNYTNIPYHKYLIHSAKLTDRWEYSAADGIANLQVMSGQRKEMATLDGLCGVCKGGFKECLFCKKVPSSKLYQHYVRTVNPIIEHCIGMHIDGVNIDKEVRSSVLHLEHQYQDAILRALDEVIPFPMGSKKQIHKFNPKSPKQMNTLFYDMLFCKPVYVKGKATMNEAAKEKVRGSDPRRFVRVLLDACSEYNASDAALLKFKVELDKGHIRTKYEPAGADTGRLKSKKSDVLPSGTNLQNVEKGPQRAAIIPSEEGTEFLHADLYAAEAFLNFLDADELDGLRRVSGLLPDQEGLFPYTEEFGCRVMTKKVSDNLKIHNWLASWIEERFPNEVKKAGFKYKDAKQLIHAMNYNVKVPMMAMESGLPASVCTQIRQMYHTLYPGIQDRMIRIQENLRRFGKLETPLGRRRYFFADLNDKLYNVAYAWPSQSTISEVTNQAMVNCRNWSQHTGFMNITRLNTHDGLVNEIRLGTREEAIRRTLDAFRTKLTIRGLTITIPVSIGFGPNFNECNGEKVYFYPLEIDR